MQLSYQNSLTEASLNPQIEIPKCRICYDQTKTLIKLCQCSGSIAYVHQKCIIQWIEKRIVCQENMISDVIPTPKCQICKVDYSAKIRIGREQISRELLWENIKKLTSFNTFFTLLCIGIYLTVFFLIGHWTWNCYWKISAQNDSIANVCLVSNSFSFENQMDLYSAIKYALIWGIFPLHYLLTSFLHLKKIKRIIIDGSKQIVADVTLIPKQILRPKKQEYV